MHTVAVSQTPELLTRRGVAELLSISESSVDRLWRAGSLPEPLRIGERCLRWDRAELLAALRATTATVDRKHTSG